MKIGIDFGTSNSACSVKTESGEIKQVVLQPESPNPYLLPSYLYFPEGITVPVVGEKAKEAFIASGYEGRFIPSFKSHLSNRELVVILIHGEAIHLERMVSYVLKNIKESVEKQFGKITSVYAGRPVILNEDKSLDQKIEDRFREAYKIADYPDPVFILEPVAAAYAYKQQLKKEEMVFVCDFGGGTLDYCLAVLEPHGSSQKDVILGTHGVRIGGDNLTGSLAHLFWNYFGYSSRIMDSMRTQWLPFPSSIFNMLSNWKNIWKIQSMEKSIKDYIRWGSSDPEGLKRLIALMDPENYFEFLNGLEKSKILLSSQQETTFLLQKEIINIERIIKREEFEIEVTNLMKQAEAGIFKIFNEAHIETKDVKTVFLTGGSSQIPIYRNIVEKIFGKEKIYIGDTFTSIANGLVMHN